LQLTLTADKLQAKTAQTVETWLESAFNQNWSRLYAVLYRLVGDPAEAEDLALESFWRLYNQPPVEKSEQSLRGWLYRVGVNLGYNALRARKRRQHYETQAGRILLDEGLTQSPDSAVEGDLERQRVRLALARMKRRSAQVLVLRYSGLSYAEIAAALKLSPGSVGTLLARAEREFKKRYQSLDV
jgi:RNA polymerase sigma-70 factor, ECF subfamily